jgi:hypothetical protein
MTLLRGGAWFSLFAVLGVVCPMGYGQTTAGTISGDVVDAQQAGVPRAKVTVKSEATGASYGTQTDEMGHFVFPVLLPGVYTLEVEGDGFRTYSRSNVVLNANSALDVGRVQLEVGPTFQKVEVTAQGEQLQTESAQRGSSIVGTQLHNIEENGRSPLFMLRLIPGAYSPNDYSQSNVNFGANYINGSRGNEANVTLNGAGNVDTGSNGSALVTVSLDSLQEFQVLTSNYQAQYGRSAGAQISVVTKSGTQSFHGSGYEYYRDKGLNANTWINNRAGLPVPQYHYNDFGFTIGGPVYVPGKFNKDKDKLFFFFSNEWQHQLVPQAQRRVTVPTALERQGDFSQSVDKNGNPVVVRNPFASGAPFPGNVIPGSLLSGPGLAILKIYPLPNDLSAANKGFNYQSQISDSEPRLEDTVRVDYNLSDRWKLFGTYVLNHQDDVSAYGSFVLGSNLPIVPISDNRPGRMIVVSATTIINPTTTNEATFDIGHNMIHIDPTVAGGMTRASLNLTGLNTLYTPNADYAPSFTFNGTRIANSPSFNTADAPFYNYNTTIEAIDNFSKVWGEHTIKTGVYVQRSRKDQTSFAPANGSINFGDNPNNPLDTGFGWANAAMGIFNSYTQASKYATGMYRYTNAEAYVQDTWRVNARLTLDYGIRFSWIQPQYDASLQTSNFLPNDWSASKAPRLYYPGFDASGNRVAVDPVTGQVLPAVAIGAIVPGSGDLLNGILQAGHGISKYLIASPGILPAPRLGLTYDVTGHHNIIFHAGGGIFYDRYQGNEIFSEITNPPTTFVPTVYYGQLANVSVNNAVLSPSSLSSLSYSGNIPTVYNYSAGFETQLPWQMVLDTSYVGSQSRHLIVLRNLNAVPYGATFQPQNQDPTLVKLNPKALPGSNALPSQFLVPYIGFASGIADHEFIGNSNYNSLQVSLNRRFAQGLFFGVAYTWSKCMDIGDTDGSYIRIDQYTRYANYGLCGFNVTQNFAANYVYGLPNIPRAISNKVTRAVLNNWQVAGYTGFISGTPVGVGFSVPGAGNAQITGSYTEGPRVALTGAPVTTGSSSPYARINAGAFLPPPVGSIGLDSPRWDLTGPGVNDWDMSLLKNVPIRESVSLQLRFDAFNVFNHTQFSGYDSTINFAGLHNPTPTNLPFNAAGQLTNVFGFGTVSGVRPPRIMQMAVHLVF